MRVHQADEWIELFRTTSQLQCGRKYRIVTIPAHGQRSRRAGHIHKWLEARDEVEPDKNCSGGSIPRQGFRWDVNAGQPFAPARTPWVRFVKILNWVRSYENTYFHSPPLNRSIIAPVLC